MSCSKKGTLYDPVSGKCLKKTSKNGKQLAMLIKLCDNDKKYDDRCGIINKHYRTKHTQTIKYFKKVMIPLVSIAAYNLFVYAVLSNSTARRKLMVFFVKKKAKVPKHLEELVEPVLVLFMSILTFVGSNLDTMKVLAGGTGLTNIGNIINHLLKLQYEEGDKILSSDHKVVSSYMASEFQPISRELPGAWPSVQEKKPDISTIPMTENNKSESIGDYIRMIYKMI